MEEIQSHRRQRRSTHDDDGFSSSSLLQQKREQLHIITMNHSSNNQQETPLSYLPEGQANSSAPYVTAPPPMGYPSKNGSIEQRVPEETTSRGDGFWKGCCAALCCCCVLDCVF
ncbi:hypothetical protein HKD37_08G022101 [Glycine soja]